MTRTIAVVQARLGSQRFPEKMLATLGAHCLLEWVVRRVKKSALLDRVVVATTREPLDDQLVAECVRLGVEVARGSTDDVLARFVEAIDGDQADAVVRVCADNPFIDPSCIDQLVREYRQHGVEYAFNQRPHGACNYADGFGAEVLSRESLLSLHRSRLTPAQREHVTLAVVDGTVAAKSHACIAPPDLAYPHLRFDVDTPHDLAVLQTLVDAGRLGIDSTAAQIVRAALAGNR